MQATDKQAKEEIKERKSFVFWRCQSRIMRDWLKIWFLMILRIFAEITQEWWYFDRVDKDTRGMMKFTRAAGVVYADARNKFACEMFFKKQQKEGYFLSFM